MKYILSFLFIIFFIGCTAKQPIISRSSIIIFKTPKMKFYDSGFITKFENHIHLQVFEVGQIALDLEIYKDEVCKSSLECISSKEFNGKYLHSSYKDDFLYNLFSANNIYFKDKQNNILIKVK